MIEDDQQLDFETSDDVTVVSSFAEMGLKEDLLRGTYSYGMSLMCQASKRASVE